MPIIGGKTKGSQRASTRASSGDSDPQDAFESFVSGMQPHNLLAAAIEGQHNLNQFLSPMFDIGNEDEAAFQLIPKQSQLRKKTRASYGGNGAGVNETKMTRNVACKNCGKCHSESDDCGTDENWCGFPNPFVDVSTLMEQCVVDITKILFGFVPSRLDITTEADMPFLLSYICGNQQVLMVPNVAEGFTLQDVQDALGFSGVPFSLCPQALILASLPASMQQFEGIYVTIPVLGSELGTGYALLRINWRDDDCGSIEVGEWVRILLGSTAGVYDITSVEESTQRISLNWLGIEKIPYVRLTHMTVPGKLYCFFDEQPTKEVDVDSDNDC